MIWVSGLPPLHFQLYSAFLPRVIVSVLYLANGSADRSVSGFLLYAVCPLDHGSGQPNSGGQTVKTTSGVNNKLWTIPAAVVLPS